MYIFFIEIGDVVTELNKHTKKLIFLTLKLY